MSEFTQSVARLRAQHERKLDLADRIKQLETEIQVTNEEFCSMLEALEYIGAISDRNTNKILDFVTGVINSTLAKIFPYDKRSIKLERTLYRDAYTHINVRLLNGEGIERDLATQSGKGLRQIISYMFMLVLTEVRKGRKLIITDELLSGLHGIAKKIMLDIIEMFAKEGFQFVIVEYGLNEGGKIYLAEKKGAISEVSEFQGTYTEDVAFVNEEDNQIAENDEVFMPRLQV